MSSHGRILADNGIPATGPAGWYGVRSCHDSPPAPVVLGLRAGNGGGTALRADRRRPRRVGPQPRLRATPGPRPAAVVGASAGRVVGRPPPAGAVARGRRRPPRGAGRRGRAGRGPRPPP